MTRRILLCAAILAAALTSGLLASGCGGSGTTVAAFTHGFKSGLTIKETGNNGGVCPSTHTATWEKGCRTALTNTKTA